MRPILFEIFTYPVPSWHFFFCLGVLAAFLSFKKLCHVFEVFAAGSKLPDLFFVLLYTAGLAGARLLGEFSVVQELPLFHREPLGNMSFHGGVLGGMTCALVLLKSKLFPDSARLRFLDAIVPSLILGLAIGRIGCFLNGDDYGLVYGQAPLPAKFLQIFGWLFPPVHGSGPGVFARHATQVQESAFSFLLFGFAAFCVALKKRQHTFLMRLPTGSLGLLLAMMSCLNRFVNEFFRADERGMGFLTSFSLPQELSLVLFAVCLTLFLFLCLRPLRAVQSRDQRNTGGRAHV